VRDYIATQFLTTSEKTARIRVWQQAPGTRKGIVLILNGFSSTLPNFGTPAQDKANINLGSYPKVAYNEGFDVWDIHWHDPRTNIEDNAMIIQELLRALVGAGFNLDPGESDYTETVNPEDKIILAGGSMGGLVGRFALCYLDANSLPYRCDTFLSVDSPQEGANIPVGLQRLAIYLDELPEDYKSGADTSLLETVINSFDSPAARQMMVHHHTRNNTQGGSPHASDRDAFQSLLLNHGNWPSNPNIRMASIANGRGDGQLQDGDPSRKIFTLPKSDSFGYLTFDWNATERVISDTTTRIPAITCFDGELRVLVKANLRIRAFATNPATKPGSSVIFRGDPVITISVTGTEFDIFGNPNGVVHSGSTVVDTSGTEEEIITRLREWIKENGTANGITCGLILDNAIDNVLSGYSDQLLEAETLEQVHRAPSTTHWDFVPGAWRTTGRFATNALAGAGTVAHVWDYHTFIPTVSAFAISGSIDAHSEVIPPNAAQLSPFDELYHFGIHSNTGHLEDFDGWLSDVIVHELRLAANEFQLDLSKAPQSINWRGLYQLEGNAGLSSSWSPLLHRRHGIYSLPEPPPASGFYRLRFFPIYE